MTSNPHTLSNRSASTERAPLVVGVRKVAIVNGTPGVLTLMENALDAGNYDIVLIESVAHAYSHIRRVQPDLVIVCVRLGMQDGFDVLSMLHLDEDTRHIPVLTFVAEFEGRESDDEDGEDKEDDTEAGTIFSPENADARMN